MLSITELFKRTPSKSSFQSPASKTPFSLSLSNVINGFYLFNIHSSTNLQYLSSSSKTHFPINQFIVLKPQRLNPVSVKATENGSGAAIAVEEKKDSDEGGNGASVAADVAELGVKFEDPKWVSGTWDLNQFSER